MSILDEDLTNILTAIKSENWAYISHHLPTWSHADQFMLLQALPPGTLEDLHHFAFEYVQYSQKKLYETQYMCDTMVTLLRAKDIYSDIESDDSPATRAQIKEAVEAMGWG
jgi:hypothetical protein